MILILGDIHGNSTRLHKVIKSAVERGAKAIIQVGDLGLFYRNGIDAGFYNATKECPIPIYFIEGNHDDCTRWLSYDVVTRVWHDANLWYVPRGTVMELDGKTFAFLGGAASIDKDYRLQNNWHWDENEQIMKNDVDKLIHNADGKKVDYLITHAAPTSVVNKHFDPRGKLMFGVGIDWHDPSQDFVDEVWQKLGYPDLICGHMHKSVQGLLAENAQYTILDINEVMNL